MAAQTSTALHQLLGLVIWGDIGPLTMYRSRQGRLVIFKKTWPDKPATPPQSRSRDSMRLCGRTWRAMALHQRALWHRVARACGCPGHGYNVWVHWSFKQRWPELRTLQQQAGIQLATTAATPTVYDPASRDIPLRDGPTFKNPELYVMPTAPWIDSFYPCEIWFMPFNRSIPFWGFVQTVITLTGPGTLTTWPAFNRTLIPVRYTPSAPDTSAKIQIAALWPDGDYTVRTVTLEIH